VTSSVTFKIVTLCACLLAVSLGVISLVIGLHRVPLTSTCAAGSVACFLTADIWRREWVRVAAWPLIIGSLVGFFFGVR
jgi:hypothetical protein